MDQAPGLLVLQDRGPGLALSPGAARSSAPSQIQLFSLPSTFSDRFFVVVLIFSLFA